VVVTLVRHLLIYSWSGRRRIAFHPGGLGSLPERAIGNRSQSVRDPVRRACSAGKRKMRVGIERETRTDLQSNTGAADLQSN